MSFPAYEEYKDSGVRWLGEMPISWTPKRLKHISPFIAVGIVVNPSTYVSDDGLPFIYGGDIRDGIIDYENSRRISPDSSDANAKTKLEVGDVLTVRVGAPGVTAVVPKECEGGNCASVMLVRKGKFDSRWLCYVMNTPVVRNQVEVVQYGAAQKQFNIEHAVNFWLPLPPLPEQKTIASFLDTETSKIDSLVSEQRRLIELLKEKRQAVISHAVTKGLNPSVPMKDSGIQWLGDVPEGWEVRRVKTVTSFVTSGPRGWSERIAEEGSLFIQSGDLNDTLQIEFENSKRVQVSDDAETTRTQLFDGDVVICVTGAKTGNVAVCFAVPETAYVNQHLCLVRPNDTMLPMFLGILLKCDLGRTYFDLSQYGLKQGLSLEDVKEAPVLVPPIEEQRIIVDFLEAETAKSDSLIAQAERAIELLQERRTALISAAVTGKIDVREFAYQETV
jgi:type I restriction enzyme S subunit